MERVALALEIRHLQTPALKIAYSEPNVHSQHGASMILATLMERLNGALRALAKACIENTKYEVKLSSQRALGEGSVRKLEASRNASGALNVALAREMVIQSHIDILKRQNKSLQGEAAKIASVENDLRKIRCVLQKAEVSHHNILEESSIFKFLAKEAPQAFSDASVLRRENLKLIRVAEALSILKDKAEISCVKFLSLPVILVNVGWVVAETTAPSPALSYKTWC